MSLLRLVALVLGLSPLPAGPNAVLAAREPSLILMLASDQAAYRVGETTTFTVAVDNPTGAAVSLLFPSGRRYDIVALAGDVEVWRWSAQRDFVDEEATVSFPPGVSLLGRETWDWRDGAGAPLAPGTYRFVSTLTSSPPRTGNILAIEFLHP